MASKRYARLATWVAGLLARWTLLGRGLRGSASGLSTVRLAVFGVAPWPKPGLEAGKVGPHESIGAQNVERWAIAAEEVRHDKSGQSRVKYFAWLCVNEQRLAI